MAKAETATRAERGALAPWWGRVEIDEGEERSWRVGPLALAVRRRPREWRVTWTRHGDDSGEPGLAATEPELARIAASTTSAGLELRPALADLQVVARLDVPFRLLGGEEVAVYVATPLWVQVTDDADQLLVDLPIQVPNETWFGRTTLVGELCYASRRAARLHLESVEAQAHLATTRVLIGNRGSTPLIVERLCIPASHLGLWVHPELGLWTQEISVERHRDMGGLADVQIADGPPAEARGAAPVAVPRSPLVKRTLVRALEALLS